MDSSVKSEETVALEADPVPPSTVTSVPETNENAQNPVLVVESIPVPLDVSHEPVAVESVEAVVSVAEVVNDINGSCNSASVEDDKLNKAMASTTLADIKQNHSEEITDKHVSDSTEKENTVVDNMSVKPVVSEKTLSEPNEIPDVEFENPCESINNEDDGVEREQQCDINKQECLPDGESTGEDEIVDEEDLGDEGGAEPDASAPEVPVPVDDDTNDPQYIPRRGRFYEHDDRMAYSTTSSEESENGYEKELGEENEGSVHQRNRKQHTDSQNQNSTTKPVNIVENNSTSVIDNTPSTKKVLPISKAGAVLKDSADNAITSDGSAKKSSGGFKKSRNIDSLNKWSHDMYDEREQTPKSKDELMVSYGYDIREESEAPRARRHHKYGRASTTKYTRNWQDTKAYVGTGGPQSSKVKRGGVAQRLVGGPYKNKNKSSTSNEYTSQFPTLDGKKTSESSTTTVAVMETSVMTKDLSQHHDQQLKSLSQEKKTVMSASKTNPTRNNFTRPPIKNVSSGNHSNQQDQKNGGPSQSSFHNKNYFNRPSIDSSANKEKSPAQVNRDNPSTPVNPNLFHRKPQQSGSNQQNQPNNFKQQHFNSQGHNQHHSSSSPRGRNFHQHNNTNQQYNHDRYFAKGSGPASSSNSNYDQHNSIGPTSAGTGRTRHSGGNYNQYNNRQYDNENDQNEQPISQPVVRSSKRYSVQSRRELPDPVLNFSAMSKTSQPQQSSISQHQQQQNGLVMQDQQQTIQQLQSQQQPPIQIHQQQPPTMQIQQFHQPIQQIHPHHGMVLDHNTGMMVMATADPSMYHQLYAAPQYATAVTPGPTAVTDDQNAAAVAAAALQMLAAQAAVYQPVPTGATGVTPPTTGTQSMQQQQPETFMTTYYQPQQQPQQQPPPRRINLAIPIVAPPPEQGGSKTSLSPTPPPTAA